jgi:hypothetical protein
MQEYEDDLIEKGKNLRVQVRWCIEKGVRLGGGSRPWQSVGQAEHLDEIADADRSRAEVLSNSSTAKPTKTVANPWVFEGQ